MERGSGNDRNYLSIDYENKSHQLVPVLFARQIENKSTREKLIEESTLFLKSSAEEYSKTLRIRKKPEQESIGDSPSRKKRIYARAPLKTRYNSSSNKLDDSSKIVVDEDIEKLFEALTIANNSDEVKQQINVLKKIVYVEKGVYDYKTEEENKDEDDYEGYYEDDDPAYPAYPNYELSTIAKISGDLICLITSDTSQFEMTLIMHSISLCLCAKSKEEMDSIYVSNFQLMFKSSIESHLTVLAEHNKNNIIIDDSIIVISTSYGLGDSNLIDGSMIYPLIHFDDLSNYNSSNSSNIYSTMVVLDLFFAIINTDLANNYDRNIIILPLFFVKVITII